MGVRDEIVQGVIGRPELQHRRRVKTIAVFLGAEEPEDSAEIRK